MMDETELIERGWRRCAAGQRTTQWCAQAEEQRQRDEALLRQALEALLGQRGEPDWHTGNQRENAITALRERLGEKVMKEQTVEEGELQ